jgi:hypothetical protein
MSDDSHEIHLTKQERGETPDPTVGERLLDGLMQTRALPGEDPVLLQRLLARVIAEVKPGDVIDTLLVTDFVHAAWEVLRLRRYKDNLLQIRARRGMVPVLTPLVDHDTEVAELYGDDWYTGSAEGVQNLADLLGAAGLTMDAAMTQTLTGHLDLFERLDCLLEGAEKRRAGALRELRAHREALALAAQKAVRDLEIAKMIGPVDGDPRFKHYAGERS